MEMNKGTGLLLEVGKIRDYDYESCYGTSQIELPDMYIIPEENIPPVHDQGNTSKCAAFSVCQCAESKMLQEYGSLTHYSPSWIYCRPECRGDYTGEGMFMSQLMKGLPKLGFLEEEYFDTEWDVPEVIELGKTRDDLVQLSQKFAPSGYVNLNYAQSTKKWDSVRDALVRSQRPLAVASRDLFRGGGHAIIAIGYSNEINGEQGKWLLIQNSWGINYGDNGRKWFKLEGFDEIYMLTWDEFKMPFKDVNSEDWFYKEIQKSYLSGLINGTSDTTFEPEGQMLRCDIACIIERMCNKLEFLLNSFARTKRDLGENIKDIKFKQAEDWVYEFCDVGYDTYYEKAVYMACANGILKGVGENKFAPKVSITRAEIAAIANRLLELVIKEIFNATGQNIANVYKPLALNDVLPTAWYFDEVSAAAGRGLIQGDPDGNFRPDDTITRAEAATIFNRLFKKIDNIIEEQIK